MASAVWRIMSEEELLMVDSGVEDNEIPDSEDLVSMEPADEADWDATKWITLSTDNAVRKRILEEGSGWECPRDGYTAFVHYSIKLNPSSAAVYDSQEGDGHPVSFVVGSADVISAITIAVRTMKKGERAEVQAKAIAAFGPEGSVEHSVPSNKDIWIEMVLVSWNEALDVTKDGGVHKKVYKCGQSWNVPRERSKCKVSYIAKDDTGKVIKQGLSEFVIGEEQEPPGLELGVRTMRVGEKAFIHCTARYAYSEAGHKSLGVGPNTPVTFDVELISFEEGPEPWNMRATDKLKFAKGCNCSGTKLLSVRTVLGVVVEDPHWRNRKDNTGFTPSHRDERHAMLLQAILGQAEVFSTQELWSNVIDCTRKVRLIDPGNADASLYIALAHIAVGDFDDAKVHLERCVSSQPDHARGNEELARVKSIIAEREAQLALADVEEESMTGSYLTMGSEEDEEEAAMIAEVAEEMSPARGSGRVRVADDGEMDVGQLSDD